MGGLAGGCAIAFSMSASAQVSDPGIFLQVEPVFPDAVKQAVLQVASAQTGLSTDLITVERAKSKIWSDGCLGLGPPGQMCTAVLVQGWEVTVANGRQEWVYRTNASGQVVKFDPVGGRLSRLVTPPAEPIPSEQMSPKWDKSVLFREVRSGGFAGITEEVLLYKDGRLERKGRSAQSAVTRRISKKELNAFKKQIYQLHFGQFNGLRYPALKGAADYFTVTLSNGQTTVQYADLNLEDLPMDLQKVKQIWQRLLDSVYLAP